MMPIRTDSRGAGLKDGRERASVPEERLVAVWTSTV